MESKKVFALKDSGERESFQGGAVRDVRSGKGRFDLITPIGIRRLIALGSGREVTMNVDHILIEGIENAALHLEGYRGEDYLAIAAWMFLAAIDKSEKPELKRLPALPPVGMRRMAVVYEKGAEKYAERNWEKGMPIGRIIDSGLRHAHQALNGETDEDHMAQAAWNMFAAMHIDTCILRGLLPAEFDDRPCYIVNGLRPHDEDL